MDDAVRHDLETVLATAVTQAISNPKDNSSLMRREASLELDKAALREDKAALRERERRLDRREAVLVEREAALVQREAALAGTKSQQPVAAATLATNGSRGSRKADPVDDVPALVEAYQTSGGVVPLGVLVAEVTALQQAASRLHTVGAAYDVQLKQLEEPEQAELAKLITHALGRHDAPADGHLHRALQHHEHPVGRLACGEGVASGAGREGAPI